ncbi:hypothetical protein OAE73_00990 [bacterium]|nr:hypothetical protein [bacterium]
MDVNLTPEQKVFVEKYNLILNRLNDIQLNIGKLKLEADEAILALNRLRQEERDLFPEE